MSIDADNKTALPVDGFPVRVLGGTFHVAEVLVGACEQRDKVIATIHDTPEDRWFVMVSDDTEDRKDALAMIDDELEFQIFAHGVLRQD